MASPGWPPEQRHQGQQEKTGDEMRGCCDEQYQAQQDSRTRTAFVCSKLCRQHQRRTQQEIEKRVRAKLLGMLQQFGSGGANGSGYNGRS